MKNQTGIELMGLFEEMDGYCKANNKPGGCGCDGCKGEDADFCADSVTNLVSPILEKRKGRLKSLIKSNIRQYHFGEADCDTAAEWAADDIIERVMKEDD